MKPTKGQLKPLSYQERELILESVRQATPEGRIWAEKVRRFASFFGRRLASKTQERFNAEAQQHLDWMTLLLLEASRSFQQGDESSVDQAMLSAALYCIDAAKASEENLTIANRHIEDLGKWLEATQAQDLSNSGLGVPFIFQPTLWQKESENVRGLVIICPSPYSLVSLSVLEICIRLNIKVEAILIRKFTAGRFFQEWRRDGPRLLKKIWRKLVLRSNENLAITTVSIAQLCDALRLQNGDMRQTARKLKIPVIEVGEFDDAVDELRKIEPQIGVFTGGGMLRKDLLEVFDKGIINPHMGPLPHYKGMDVVQAPILEGCFNSIAITTHYMVPKLDAGPVFEKFEVSSDLYESLAQLRNEISAIMPLIAIDTVLGIYSNRLHPIKQPIAGRQYFFSHPRLVETIKDVMSTRALRRNKTNDYNPVHEVVGALIKELGT